MLHCKLYLPTLCKYIFFLKVVVLFFVIAQSIKHLRKPVMKYKEIFIPCSELFHLFLVTTYQIQGFLFLRKGAKGQWFGEFNQHKAKTDKYWPHVATPPPPPQKKKKKRKQQTDSLILLLPKSVLNSCNSAINQTGCAGWPVPLLF